MTGRKPTWAAIRRRIGKGTELTCVNVGTVFAAPTEGRFTVKRVTGHGMYLVQHHQEGEPTNVYVHWPNASMVTVDSADRWIVATVKGLQAWAIL